VIGCNHSRWRYASLGHRRNLLLIHTEENLFPVQIENALSEHPNIHEASVVAVPDDKYGEAVGVWVKLRTPGKTTGQDIREWVGEKMNRQVSSVVIERTQT